MFESIKHCLVLLCLTGLFCVSGVVSGSSLDAPVLLQRTTARLTTSAFDEGEMRRFFEQIFSQRRGTRGRVSGVGVVSAELERPPLTEKNRLSALLHWESDLVLSDADDGTYVFGSSQPEAPWAVFLNGQYCGGWQNGTPETVQLARGIHRLQFLAVQKNGAGVPGLKILKKEGASLKEHPLTLQPVPEVSFVRLGAAPPAMQRYLSGWQLTGRYHFLATDQYLDCWQKNEETELSDEGECFHRSSDGTRQKLPPSGELFVAGRDGMSLEWEVAAQKEFFPSAPCWPLAVPVYVRISLENAPLILSAREVFNVRLHQSWPEALPEYLKTVWKLRCRQYDREGVLLSDERISMQYQPDLDCSLTPDSAAHLLSWQPEIGGIPAAKAVELQIIRPQKFPENPEFCGNLLLVAGRRAVLQCDPLRKRSSSGLQNRRKLPDVAVKLYYFDDGLGNTHASRIQPSDSQRTERFFQQLKGFSPGRILLPEIPGAEPELQSIAAFAGLLNMRPDMAVLNLGERELKAGCKPLAWCRQLLFFAQASLAAGIEPMLLAYPEMPGIDRSVSRQTALLTKELGLTLGIAVADLYSQRILEDVDTVTWFVDAAAEHQTVGRPGRRWQAEKVLEALLSNPAHPFF